MNQSQAENDVIDHLTAATNATYALASGWSDAAGNYAKWLADELKKGAVSDSAKLSKAAVVLQDAFSQAAQKAHQWRDAAAAAGKSGIAETMRNYADKFALLGSGVRAPGSGLSICIPHPMSAELAHVPTAAHRVPRRRLSRHGAG